MTGYREKFFRFLWHRLNYSHRRNTDEYEDGCASDIDFNSRDFVGNEVGVVYIVCNDYESQRERRMAMGNHGKDFNNMKKFFNVNCNDKYYVEPHKCATAKRFLDTCKYLANPPREYPKNCDRIIIYFSGHGQNDQYILMEPDFSSNKSDREVHEECKIHIEKILATFRNSPKMSRIILLDACCSATGIKCEENELVAAAASDGTSAWGSPDTGGFWTDELCLQFGKIEPGDSVGINALLEVVQSTMNQSSYCEYRNITKKISATINGELKDIYFMKKKDKEGNIHFLLIDTII